jgi:hypothetical protein
VPSTMAGAAGTDRTAQPAFPRDCCRSQRGIRCTGEMATGEYE